MAKRSHVFHPNPYMLMSKMNKIPSRKLGENVGSGKCMERIHYKMLEHASNYANMIDRRYEELDVATVRGSDGVIYLCQLF